ncbi:MAG: hypothetical protein E6H09_09975 [Bacteroidetes bacterium]|nr:MAG: hypothetical protein E6H09_09975 [Bacteroidota bacterium]
MKKQVKTIRRWMIFFMVTLFISGLTAIPAETELQFLSKCFSPGTALGNWIERVYIGVANTNKNYPFISYGYDWLAFAHFVLAILFIGPFRHPVRNKWVIEFGMIACILIIPFALIAGQFRGVPFGWRMIDCSFGIIGLLPLVICYRRIQELEQITTQEASYEN